MENSNDINNATIENNTTVEPEVEQEPIKEKKRYIFIAFLCSMMNDLLDIKAKKTQNPIV